MTNKLLLQYVSPCIGEKYEIPKQLPNYEIFKKLKNSEDIRNYFFTKHNQKEINQNNLIHLVLPYKIYSLSNEEIETELFLKPKRKFPKSQFKKNFPKENFSLAELEGIIITHFLKPVDYLSQEEFKKYEDSFIL